MFFFFQRSTLPPAYLFQYSDRAQPGKRHSAEFCFLSHSNVLPPTTPFCRISKQHRHSHIIVIPLTTGGEVKCRVFFFMHVTKVYRGSRDIAPLILNLDTRRWWVYITLRPLYPPRGNCCIHCIIGWVGPGAGLDVSEKTRYPVAVGMWRCKKVKVNKTKCEDKRRRPSREKP